MLRIRDSIPLGTDTIGSDTNIHGISRLVQRKLAAEAFGLPSRADKDQSSIRRRPRWWGWLIVTSTTSSADILSSVEIPFSRTMAYSLLARLDTARRPLIVEHVCYSRQTPAGALALLILVVACCLTILTCEIWFWLTDLASMVCRVLQRQVFITVWKWKWFGESDPTIWICIQRGTSRWNMNLDDKRLYFIFYYLNIF